jgi:hypothetical protein
LVFIAREILAGEISVLEREPIRNEEVKEDGVGAKEVLGL